MALLAEACRRLRDKHTVQIMALRPVFFADAIGSNFLALLLLPKHHTILSLIAFPRVLFDVVWIIRLFSCISEKELRQAGTWCKRLRLM